MKRTLQILGLLAPIMIGCAVIAGATPCDGPMPYPHVAAIKFANGTCRVWTAYYGYWDPAHNAPVIFDNIAAGYGEVVHVETGPDTAVWVCPYENPIGITLTHEAPCWNGTYDSLPYRRVRGPRETRPWGFGYGAASRDIDISGKTIVISQGWLPNPPTCPYYYPETGAPVPFNEHACAPSADGPSDQTIDLVKQNSDPSDSTNCCNVSAPWPNGIGSGRSCTAHSIETGNYATVVYDCPVD